VQVRLERKVLTVAAMTSFSVVCLGAAWFVPQALSGHDQTPPETYITAGPPVRTTDRTPSFSFAASEQAARFVCKLDARPFKPCTSPKTLRLARGRHGFYVKAIDAFSNKDATAVAYRFKVVKP
jgi:hypothetical protein